MTGQPPYRVGLARSVIRIRTRHIGMMGYGMLHNRAEGMASDLYVRACVITDPAGHCLAYANAEICFITLAIRSEVLKRLQHMAPQAGFCEENLMLTAQHTHSAPGGYSHYVFYNITIPGFQPEVFEAIVSAFCQALLQAWEHQAPARLAFVQGAFPPDREVAFNRSLEAFNRNPEVPKYSPYETHLALDRHMYLLKILSPEGQLRGLINWFGVHATSIGPDNRRISADNKGIAAYLLEKKMHDPDFVAIFAQGAAGDVSPNFYGQGRSWPRGKFPDDYESAWFNGRLQCEQAWELLHKPAQDIQGPLSSELVYVDFSQVECDPRFTGGIPGCRTASAAHGVAFFKGTAVDGKGISGLAACLLSALAQRLRKAELQKAAKASEAEKQRILARYAAQDPKEILLDCGEKRFLGMQDLKNLPIPDFIEPVIAELKRLHRLGALREHTWVPHILPIQLSCLGSLALAAVPGEITTVAAWRLRAGLAQRLACRGIAHVIIGSYANAYHGYITTPEEYEVQNYEGGHTVFGKWTLPAFQTHFDQLAAALCHPDQVPLDKALRPPAFSAEELALRTAPITLPKVAGS